MRIFLNRERNENRKGNSENQNTAIKNDKIDSVIDQLLFGINDE